MNHSCCMVGCDSVGTKFCAACGMASYCSSDCQKEDWKVHKDMCINFKKLSTTFLSMSQIGKVLQKFQAQKEHLEAQGGKVEEIVVLLLKTIRLLEHQLGVEIPGTSDYERIDGDVIDNWCLINLHLQLSSNFNLISDEDAALAHAIRTRELLEHQDKSNNMYYYLVEIERIIFMVYQHRGQFDLAEHHCEQSLKFSRLITDERRHNNEYQSLILYGSILESLEKYVEGIDISEKAYVLASEVYGPVHKDVQQAGVQLIRCLITSGDHARAGKYCHMNYENLTDPRNGIDQKCCFLAYAMMQIAQVWLNTDPVDDEKTAYALEEEAEDMARKSVKLGDIHGIGTTCRLEVLGKVLFKRGKYTDEARMIYESLLGCDRQYPDREEAETIRVLAVIKQFLEHERGSDCIPP